MPKSEGLNPKQKRFILEYVKDLNGTKAAIRAGYSKTGAKMQAIRMLRDVTVSAEIAKLISEQNERRKIDADFVLDTIHEILTRCMDPKDFDARGATKAVELLAKHVGLFRDREQQLWERKLEEEKLELMKKRQGADDDSALFDDGFIEAIQASAKAILGDT